MANHPNKLPNLEESLTEIAGLIDKMEHSELTLEQSLNQFERGISLIKHCQKILEDAEQKVELLLQNNNQEELIKYGEINHEEGPAGNENNQ